ncbi:uncharacterized protein CLUP02_08921 [Colletotrichum lupini]|uniref:Uncharacterized protein n=1 Tax=Colletotrichum lupini TaxID=145971 RepID=A0A9Q8SV63_9PEZI|nr:uncharacterized protein CLUP02_08921 [Colletotrichum lupini]UQC83426.1 hypothetical protein CLUP02_08921 [Colletotrichum lupini]
MCPCLASSDWLPRCDVEGPNARTCMSVHAWFATSPYVTLLSPAPPAAGAAITKAAGPMATVALSLAVFMAGGPMIWDERRSPSRLLQGEQEFFEFDICDSMQRSDFLPATHSGLSAAPYWPAESSGSPRSEPIRRSQDCQTSAMADRNPEGPNPLATIAYCHFDQHVVRVAMTDRGASRKLALVQLVTCSLSALLEWSPSGESKSS